jgi:hypothetical protein
MKSEIRKSHTLNREACEFECASATCRWYGNAEECDADPMGEFECPECGDDTISFGFGWSLSNDERRTLICALAHGSMVLNTLSKRYKAQLRITGFGNHVDFRIIDDTLPWGNKEDEDYDADSNLVVGSYSCESEIAFESDKWDAPMFRDWVNGIAELTESEGELYS